MGISMCGGRTVFMCPKLSVRLQFDSGACDHAWRGCSSPSGVSKKVHVFTESSFEGQACIVYLTKSTDCCRSRSYTWSRPCTRSCLSAKYRLPLKTSSGQIWSACQSHPGLTSAFLPYGSLHQSRETSCGFWGSSLTQKNRLVWHQPNQQLFAWHGSQNGSSIRSTFWYASSLPKGLVLRRDTSPSVCFQEWGSVSIAARNRGGTKDRWQKGPRKPSGSRERTSSLSRLGVIRACSDMITAEVAALVKTLEHVYTQQTHHARCLPAAVAAILKPHSRTLRRRKFFFRLIKELGERKLGVVAVEVLLFVGKANMKRRLKTGLESRSSTTTHPGEFSHSLHSMGIRAGDENGKEWWPLYGVDDYCHTAVLSALGRSKEFGLALEMFNWLQECGNTITTFTCNVVLGILCQANRLRDAEALLWRMGGTRQVEIGRKDESMQSENQDDGVMDTPLNGIRFEERDTGGVASVGKNGTDKGQMCMSFGKQGVLARNLQPISEVVDELSKLQITVDAYGAANHRGSQMYWPAVATSQGVSCGGWVVSTSHAHFAYSSNVRTSYPRQQDGGHIFGLGEDALVASNNSSAANVTREKPADADNFAKISSCTALNMELQNDQFPSVPSCLPSSVPSSTPPVYCPSQWTAAETGGIPVECKVVHSHSNGAAVDGVPARVLGGTNATTVSHGQSLWACSLGCQTKTACDRDTVSYNAVIGAYGRKGEWRKALQLWEMMKKDGVSPNSITCNLVMRVCEQAGKCQECSQVWKEMREMGILASDYTVSILISSFGKAGQYADALALVKELRMSRSESPFVSLQTYNMLIHACTLAGELKGAIQAFEWLKDDKLTPDVITFNTLIGAFEAAGKWEQALQTYEMMRLAGCKADAVTWTQLICVYTTAGMHKKALNVFLDMLERSEGPTDIRSWNAALAACAHGHMASHAKYLWSQIRRRGVHPNAVTYTMMIDAMGKSGDLETAIKLHEEMQEHGHQPSVITFNTLISACSRRRDFFKAARFFSLIGKSGLQPTVVSYNAFIQACGRAKEGVQTMAAFRRMVESGLNPDDATYTLLLEALAFSGLAEDALDILGRMRSEGVAVTARHFSRIINACVRAGEFEVALDVYADIQADGSSDLLCPLSCMLALRACAHLGHWQRAINIFTDFRKLLDPHEPTVEAYNLVIGSCETAGRMTATEEEGDRRGMRDAERGMREDDDGGRKAVVAIVGTDCHDWLDAARTTYDEMRRRGVHPNLQTYATLVKAFEMAGCWNEALKIYSSILMRQES